jgi:hypothetical protein
MFEKGVAWWRVHASDQKGGCKGESVVWSRRLTLALVLSAGFVALAGATSTDGMHPSRGRNLQARGGAAEIAANFDPVLTTSPVGVLPPMLTKGVQQIITKGQAAKIALSVNEIGPASVQTIDLVRVEMTTLRPLVGVQLPGWPALSGDLPVYVIQVRGSYVGASSGHVFLPSGSSVEQALAVARGQPQTLGHVFHVIIDAMTGRVLAEGQGAARTVKH